MNGWSTICSKVFFMASFGYLQIFLWWLRTFPWGIALPNGGRRRSCPRIVIRAYFREKNSPIETFRTYDDTKCPMLNKLRPGFTSKRGKNKASIEQWQRLHLKPPFCKGTQKTEYMLKEPLDVILVGENKAIMTKWDINLDPFGFAFLE